MGELYEERVKLFRDTIAMEKTSRVPNLANVFTWKILDSEFTLSEAFHDYDKMKKLVCDFHERYQFDAYMDLGARNPVRTLDALGTSYYHFSDDGSINVTDHVLMQPDEYEEYASDPNLFTWAKLMQRKFPNATGQQIGAAVLELLNHANYTTEIGKIFTDEYECPSVFAGSNVVLPPYEYFFQTARGIKDFSRDVRRNSAELKDAMDAQFERNVMPGLGYALTQDTSTFVCDIYMAIIGYTILNEKQFAELYWPYIKSVIDRVVASGKTLYLFCEGEMLRLADFFADIPQGHVVLHLETDDIFEVRKKLPNLCLAGGMPTSLLGKGTPEECVGYAKMLIDELGDGYIFSQNKMVSFKGDCKRENLIAVNDFVRGYRR